MKAQFFCILCFSVVFSVGEECTAIKKEKDDEISFESSTSCSSEFQLKFPGYQMEAEIQELKLDSSQGSYLTLKPEHDEKEYKFVWTQKVPKKFIIDQTKVTVTFYSTSARNRFKLHLKRHGELTTTVEPTTIVTWPSPQANDSIYHTVNVAISTEEFSKQEIKFKNVLADMTSQYCKKYHILLAENVTSENIKLQFAIQCLSSWPDYSNCVQIKYAIPVILESDRYELTSENLKKMWDEMAEEYLKESLSWGLYEVPDTMHHLMIWLIISMMILVLFFGFLFFARIFSMRFGGIVKRRASDTQQIIGTPTRVSDASLWPTPVQIIPPLFENENPYTYFEPDTNFRPHQQPLTTNTMMGVDDSSDEEVLTVNRNSGVTNYNQNYNQNVIHLDIDHNKESAL